MRQNDRIRPEGVRWTHGTGVVRRRQKFGTPTVATPQGELVPIRSADRPFASFGPRPIGRGRPRQRQRDHGARQGLQQLGGVNLTRPSRMRRGHDLAILRGGLLQRAAYGAYRGRQGARLGGSAEWPQSCSHHYPRTPQGSPMEVPIQREPGKLVCIPAPPGYGREQLQRPASD